MWFKNLRIYRITGKLELDPDRISDKLKEHRFKPCASLDYSRYGWVPPLGTDAELYSHAANGRLLLCARRQEKILPAAAVREALDARVAELAAREARQVFRRERRNLKDEIIHSLLPRALTRSTRIQAYFDGSEYLLIDTPSLARAEESLDCLRHSLGGLPLEPLRPQGAPAEVMTRWLQGRLPGAFTLDQDCDLRNPHDAANVIRCRRQELHGAEVRGHLQAGKQVIQLALNWRDAIRFAVDEELCIRRLRFDDRIQKEAAADNPEDFAAQFDQEFSVMSLQLDHLVADLIEAFGGPAG